jgi:endoglucanase
VSARRTLLSTGVAAIAALCMLCAPSLVRATSLSISIVGNHFVNGGGQTVRLLGVDREGTEYACTYGYASSGPIDGGDARVIAGWGADAVRVPLNEDCWLGINGLPADGLSAASYRSAIESYVADLNADGIYAILDLHWSAPGSTQSTGQYPMPDAHSVDFWTSVAGAFASNPAVVFDVFNEPYSPHADGWSSAYTLTWSCWLDGGCSLPNAVDGTTPSANPQTYQAVGMQSLVTAIRDTGATQPIIVGGLSYANDLSGWLANEPSDPDQQVAASFHNYTGEPCDTVACWNSTVAPVAARVPVVTGEFDEDDCPTGGGSDPANFDNTFMGWADAHGVSYLGWGWLVLDPLEGCSALTLLDDYSGTAADPNGVALRDHLLALAANVSPPPPLSGGSTTAPATTVPPASLPPSTTGESGSPLTAQLEAFVSHYRHLPRAAPLRRARLDLRFTAWAPGTLEVRVLSGAVVIASGRRDYRYAASATISLRLTVAGRRDLRRRHAVHGEVVAFYTPIGGLTTSAHAATTLSRAA